jgi:hypothetical protein
VRYAYPQPPTWRRPTSRVRTAFLPLAVSCSWCRIGHAGAVSGRIRVPEEDAHGQQDVARAREASWEVRPVVLVHPQVEPADLRRVEAELRLVVPVAVGMLAVGPKGGQALGAMLVVRAATPGAAADYGIEVLLAACKTAGVATAGLREVTVQAAGRNPRDW